MEIRQVQRIRGAVRPQHGGEHCCPYHLAGLADAGGGIIPGSQRRSARKKTSTSSSIVQRRFQSRRPRSRLLRQKGQMGQQRPGLRKLQKGLGNRNSQQVRQRDFPRRRRRLNQTLVGPEFWHSKNSSRAWRRTRTRHVSEAMRVTLPPTKWARHHHTLC